MAGISGKDGTVATAGGAVAEVTNWKLDMTSNNPAFASSDSAGAKQRVPGVKDGSGSLEAVALVADTGVDSELDEGDLVTLTLDTGDGPVYTVPSIIDKVAMEVDVDDGNLVKYAIDFSIDGAWTLS